jgi:hypothetical protein
MSKTVHKCDFCDKPRRSLTPTGRGPDGVYEAAICFVCIVESKRGKVYSTQEKRYIAVTEPDP